MGFRIYRLLENPVLPESFTQIYILFLIDSVLALLKCTNGSKLTLLKSKDGSELALLKFIDGSKLALLKSIDGSELALLKSIDGSVLALPNFSSIFSHHNSKVSEFGCTIASMQEKQQNFLFEIECHIFVNEFFNTRQHNEYKVC